MRKRPRSSLLRGFCNMTEGRRYMATITITGVEDVLGKFEKMTAAMEPAFAAAAQAGGELMAERIKASAPVRTGGVSKSIKAGAPKHSMGDGFYSTVEPTGSDSHGESYAKIVNILEYSATRGHPFFYSAVDAASGEVQGKMASMVREALAK